MVLVVLMLLSILSSCSGDKKVTLRIYNWGDYIDEEVLGVFEERYDMKIIYENFATNEDMYVKLKSGGGNYDVIFPSDYMIKRMINEDMLHEIDLKNIPNFIHTHTRFRSLSYDPQNAYSVPYMWGTVGILYNTTMVDEPVDSWQILWDERYAKNIFMLDSQRDSIAVALKLLGYSLNTRDQGELEEAKNALIRQKPLVLAYVGDEVKDKMISGEAALAVVWSGDAVYLKWENEDLEYIVPQEGSNLWFDAMAIPKTSKHKKEAEQFINFLCEPEIALMNTEYIGYSTPNATAMSMIDPEWLSDPVAYPTEEDVAHCEVFEDLSDILEVYNRIWDEVMASR